MTGALPIASRMRTRRSSAGHWLRARKRRTPIARSSETSYAASACSSLSVQVSGGMLAILLDRHSPHGSRHAPRDEPGLVTRSVTATLSRLDDARCLSHALQFLNHRLDAPRAQEQRAVAQPADDVLTQLAPREDLLGERRVLGEDQADAAVNLDRQAGAVRHVNPEENDER